MKVLYFLLFSALGTLCLCSCLVNHQRLGEQSISYDGVWIEKNDTVYQLNGKKYIRGERAQFQYQRNNSYISFKEAIIGPSKWDWKKVESSEGEIVYREVDNDGYYVKGGTWTSLDMSKASTKKLEYEKRPYDVDSQSHHLTLHALYSLPAAAICIVPDMACSIALWTLHGTGMLVQGIVLLPVSQQQQQAVPVLPPKPVAE